MPKIVKTFYSKGYAYLYRPFLLLGIIISVAFLYKNNEKELLLLFLLFTLYASLTTAIFSPHGGEFPRYRVWIEYIIWIIVFIPLGYFLDSITKEIKNIMMHDISIIIPVFNEEESLNELIDQLDELVNRMNEKSIEIIFIDDGSNDNTNRIIVKKTKHKDYIKLITLIRNFGQTAAISAGIDNSNGKVLITMDSDLQNSCNDIPKLIKELNKGYDVVSGWRKERRDGFFTRVLPSKLQIGLYPK